MRHWSIAILAASAVSVGLAQAAPGFGASSPRLGGGSYQGSEKPKEAIGFFEALLVFAGFEMTASVRPVAGESIGGPPPAKECDKQKKTEVAKAEDKETTEGGAGSSKGRGRTGEPVYLAF
jgi:hypothetical protein